jgi:hypothetical protein
MMNHGKSNTRKCAEKDTNVNLGAATNAADAAVAAVASRDGVHLNVSLSEFLDGILFCETTELTRELLLDYLNYMGETTPCKLMDVSVRTAEGATTVVEIPVGSPVGALKDVICEKTGTRWEKQQLFNDTTATCALDTTATCALDNETLLHVPRELFLFVGDTQFNWIRKSSALALERFHLMNDVHMVAMAPVSAFVMARECYSSQTISASPSMHGDAGETVFTASFRVTMPPAATVVNSDKFNAANCQVRFGVAAMGDHDYADHADTDIYNEPAESWYVDPKEAIPYGAVVCLTLNFEEGTLTFSVNGVSCDGGRTDIPTDASMKWFVEAALPETVIEIGADMMSD